MDGRFTRTRYPLHRLRFTLPPRSFVLNLFPTAVLSIALVWGRSGGGTQQEESGGQTGRDFSKCEAKIRDVRRRLKIGLEADEADLSGKLMSGRAAWTEMKHLGVVLTTQDEITGKIQLQVF